MLMFEFPNADACLRYWQVICELQIDNEKERQEILMDFVRNKEITSVRQTNRTRDQVVKDFSRHMHIMDIRAKREDEDGNQ